MEKFKNFLATFIIFIIIIFSFLFPKVLFKIEDLKMEKEVYTTAKKESKIDVEAENIYLVRAIHAISEAGIATAKTSIVDYTGKIVVSLDREEAILKDCENELSKLQEYNILKKFDEKALINLKYNGEVGYYNGNIEYSVEDILANMTSENLANYMNIEIEDKTKKVLFMTIPEENLYGENKQEILTNFVKYLEIYIIGDWKYEEILEEKISNYFLTSEKAQISAMLIKYADMDRYYLTIKTLKQNTELIEIFNK